MLNFSEVKAVDVSDFEGAEVIINLNKPLPNHLESTCDLLVDGSTLDNIFDPVRGLKNIARMLKPNGRCFIINAGNAPLNENSIPYTLFNPMWFFDYFAWNNFEFCQVYCQLDYGSRASMFEISYDHAARRWDPGLIKTFHTTLGLSVIVFAEKGENSTWELNPIEHAYRPEKDWTRYEQIVKKYKASPRLPLLRPRCDDNAPKTGVPCGWNRIFSDGAIARQNTTRSSALARALCEEGFAVDGYFRSFSASRCRCRLLWWSSCVRSRRKMHVAAKVG